MQIQTILAIVFSALLIFSCRKDDESVENSIVIGEVKDDTSQVDTITPLEPSGVENGCLLSGSIDSAELLWNNAVDERGGNYVYQVRNAVFCCDVYTTEFKVESNIIVKSTYQTWDNYPYGEITESINYDSTASTFNQVFDRCRNVKKEADSLNYEYQLSYSSDGVVCKCGYQIPDSLITCTDACPTFVGIESGPSSFKWTE